MDGRHRFRIAIYLLMVASLGGAGCGNAAPAGNGSAAEQTAPVPASPENDPVTHDPSNVNPDYPPAMGELSFTSAGSKLNGLIYLANGPGPHPTLALLHGYAGNERNLDLAQAIRRAGYNVLYFNYRGTWGSGGTFSASNAVADVASALAMLRERAVEYRVDPERLALVGHSFGGFTATMGTLADPDVRCLAFIAGANLGAMGTAAAEDPEVLTLLREGLGASMDFEGGPIAADPAAALADIVEHAAAFDLTNRAPELTSRPLLLVAGTRDTEATKNIHHDPFLAALQSAGHARITEVVFDDDHSFSAHRIALARTLVQWLDTTCFEDPGGAAAPQ